MHPTFTPVWPQKSSRQGLESIFRHDIEVWRLRYNHLNRNRLVAGVEQYCLIWAFASLPSCGLHLGVCQCGPQRWLVGALDWAVALVKLAPAVRRLRLSLTTTSPLPPPCYPHCSRSHHRPPSLSVCSSLSGPFSCLHMSNPLLVLLSSPFTFQFIHFVDAKANYRPLMAGYDVCVFQELQCAGLLVCTELSHSYVQEQPTL